MPTKRILRKVLVHLVLIALGLVMIYPLIWLFFGSFKTNREILGGGGLLPEKFLLEGYILGWKNDWQYNFGHFLGNTFRLVVPTVFFSVLSTPLVAYGFARFRFRGHKLLFALMLSTLMLPNTVVIVPRYILFRNFGWLDSYLPFTIPALLATTPFHIFMVYQFIRGLPRELDESAMIDGCGPVRIYCQILLPLLKPVIVSVAVFQFIWSWNDFFNVLIFISSVHKYTLTLGLRMMLDIDAASAWNQIMAMSVVSLLPCALFYFFTQKYFVEGIATTGLKG